MDLASGLCHYCTMGLPPQKLFLSIHSNWMPLLKPSVTDRGRQLSQEVFLQCLITWRQQATYCVGNPLLWASRDGWCLSSMFVWPYEAYVLYVYI